MTFYGALNAKICTRLVMAYLTTLFQKILHITYWPRVKSLQYKKNIIDKKSHCALPCFFQTPSLAFVMKARSSILPRMKPLGSTWPCITLSMNIIHYQFKKPLWIYYIVENMRRKFPFNRLLQSLPYTLLFCLFLWHILYYIFWD